MAPGTDQTLTWLVTQSGQIATAVSDPQCGFNLVFDNGWRSKITQNQLLPAFASWASNPSQGKEAVVVLHNPGIYNGYVLIMTQD